MLKKDKQKIINCTVGSENMSQNSPVSFVTTATNASNLCCFFLCSFTATSSTLPFHLICRRHEVA